MQNGMDYMIAESYDAINRFQTPVRHYSITSRRDGVSTRILSVTQEAQSIASHDEMNDCEAGSQKIR